MLYLFPIGSLLSNNLPPIEQLAFYQRASLFLRKHPFNDNPISLDALSEASISKLFSLGTDPVIWRHARYPKTEPHQFKNYFDKVIARKDSLNFAVTYRPASQLIGFTRLKSVDLRQSCAETGTWLIPESQNKGLNFYLKQILLAIAFEVLHLSYVYCYVSNSNLSSLKSLRRMGFDTITDNERVKTDHQHQEVYQQYLVFHCSNYDSHFRQRLSTLN